MTRNYDFEALAEVTGSDWNTARGELNAALKSIRAESGIEDSYILAAEIHERAKMYRQVFEGASLTPNALAKHWKRVFEEAQVRKPKATNQSAAATECSTCGGDRFVLVSLRRAKVSPWMAEHGLEPPEDAMLEEVAACPDCGPAVQPFRRYDGSLVVPPDPAKTREMMRS